MPMFIAFLSQKGGVGKSTLARALGSVVAHAGLSVMIADLDPQQSTTINWSNLRKRAPSDPEIIVRSFASIEYVLPDADKFDVVVIDAPGRASRNTLDIARAAHFIVIPTGPSLDDLHPTVLLHHELLQAGIASARLECAICRTLTKEEERDAREYLVEAGCNVLSGALPERAAYRSAQNRGRALTETSNTDLNATADALMESLLNRIAALFEPATRKQPSKGKGSAA